MPFVSSEERSRYNKDYLERRKLAGLCTRCGKPNDTDNDRCSDCARKNHLNAKKLVAEGFCRNGRHPNDRPDHVVCLKCERRRQILGG